MLVAGLVELERYSKYVWFILSTFGRLLGGFDCLGFSVKFLLVVPVNTMIFLIDSSFDLVR